MPAIYFPQEQAEEGSGAANHSSAERPGLQVFFFECVSKSTTFLPEHAAYGDADNTDRVPLAEKLCLIDR